MIRTANRRVRPGFTLVELMVAAAICVLIMAILASAFQMGIDTMRQMKSSGEMMDQLRGATTALQYDLRPPHLLDKDGQPKKLSSFRWDLCFVDKDTTTGKYTRVRMKDASGTVGEWAAPDNGFVRIGSGPLTDEGQDADGLGSGRATNHYLHFTTILNGQSDDDYYAATTPALSGPTYRSTVAEIAYFLEPSAVGTTPGGTPLFRLIRRQRLAALADTDRRDRPWPSSPDLGVISLRPSGSASPPYFLCTLGELTSPTNRLGGSVAGAGYTPAAGPKDDLLAPMSTRPGEDTLLSNVLSFEVQVIYKFPQPDGKLPVVLVPATTVAYPRLFNIAGSAKGSTTTSDNPFDTLPENKPTTGANTQVAASTYDSWNQGMAQGSNDWTTKVDPNTGVVQAGPNVPPLLIQVQAVQIRIRIWDPKLQTARQVTFVQDL